MGILGHGGSPVTPVEGAATHPVLWGSGAGRGTVIVPLLCCFIVEPFTSCCCGSPNSAGTCENSARGQWSGLTCLLLWSAQVCSLSTKVFENRPQELPAK